MLTVSCWGILKRKQECAVPSRVTAEEKIMLTEERRKGENENLSAACKSPLNSSEAKDAIARALTPSLGSQTWGWRPRCHTSAQLSESDLENEQKWERMQEVDDLQKCRGGQSGGTEYITRKAWKSKGNKKYTVIRCWKAVAVSYSKVYYTALWGEVLAAVRRSHSTYGEPGLLQHTECTYALQVPFAHVLLMLPLAQIESLDLAELTLTPD